MLTNDTPVITDEGAWTDDFPTRPLGRSGNVVRSLAEQLDSRLGRSRVIGESAPWQGVLKKATQVAATCHCHFPNPRTLKSTTPY